MLIPRMLTARILPFHRLLGIGLLMEAGFAVLGRPGMSVPARVLIQSAIFILYLVSLREGARLPLEGGRLAAVLGLAALFRLTLVGLSPFYSDDLFRYLWDGRVQAAGKINPYLYPPNDAALAFLRDAHFSRINHPDVPTVYPPAAQLLFAAVAAWGSSPLLLKGILTALDLATAMLLLRILRGAGFPAGRILIYAWCPLVVAEVSGNGHVDALAIFFLVLGIQLIIAGRPALSTAPLGLSVTAKFLPILALPLLLRRVRLRYRPIPFLIVAALYLPYRDAGWTLFRGLKEYAERWRQNDSLFGIILAALEAVHPTEVLKAGIAGLQSGLHNPPGAEILYHYAYPVYLARLAAALLVATWALALAFRKAAPVRGTFGVLGASLLLSPTVHPWYVLWIVPFLVLRPHRAWILLTGLVPLSYLDPAPVINGSRGKPLVGWIEYLPFFLLLVGDAVLSRRRRRTATLFGLTPLPESAAGEPGGKAGPEPPPEGEPRHRAP